MLSEAQDDIKKFPYKVLLIAGIGMVLKLAYRELGSVF